VLGAEAFGAPSDEGFIIFRGSTGLSRSTEAMRGAIALKEELLAARKLVREGALVRFQEDVLFGTPSQAGSMVNGSSCNGRVAWKRVSDGRTLNEIESDEAG
jgi:hypothetical protein